MKPPSTPIIGILLATYQGAKYLPEFLQSLQRQTHDRWELLVRDDGSSDGTLSLLRQFAAEDERISILPVDPRRLGSAQNFGVLAAHALEKKYAFTAFADQDDLWDECKLERQLSAMNRLEQLFGAGHPLLVHSDLSVIDGAGRRVADSYEQFARLKRPDGDDVRSRLVSNDVAGCGILLNFALLRAAVPVPLAASMHDWWIALCAACLGHIEYLSEPLVKYRIHATNTVGGATPWQRFGAMCFGGIRQWRRLRQDFASSVSQASALVERLESLGVSASDGRLRQVEDYCRTMQMRSRWSRTCRAYFAPRKSMHPLRELALLAKFFSFNVDARRAAIDRTDPTLGI